MRIGNEVREENQQMPDEVEDVQPKDTPMMMEVYEPPQLMLSPVVTVAELVKVQGATADLIVHGLKEGLDYGKIPGTDKQTLLKPGAERITAAFGCQPEFEIIEREADHSAEMPWSKRKKVWNNAYRGDRTFRWDEETGKAYGLYRYVVRCSLRSRQSQQVVGTGIGICSSLEAKYCDRPRDMENTIVKMAQKRAFVAAVLTTFSLSDRFTQDVEDLLDEVPEPEPTPKASKAAKEKPKQEPETSHKGSLDDGPITTPGEQKMLGYSAFLASLKVTPTQRANFEKYCKDHSVKPVEFIINLQTRGVQVASIDELAAELKKTLGNKAKPDPEPEVVEAEVVVEDEPTEEGEN